MFPSRSSSMTSTNSTPQNPPPPYPADQPGWQMKLLAKGLGTAGGIFSLAFGLFATLSFGTSCIAAGLLQMFVGFCVVALEAPCCCACLDFINQLTNFSENRPHWQKFVLYCSISPIPLFLCFEISTFFGLAIIFACGMLYGMMALGKKADRETMIARVIGQSKPDDNMDVNLVDKNKQPNIPTV